YWINMGALAITTLAGARLMAASGEHSMLEAYRPFVLGFTTLFWGAATWWIPLLVAVGIWRQAWRRVPLRYDPQYWSLVFPLGMYSVATYVFSSVTGFAFLEGIAGVSAVVALGAWGVVCTGMIRALQRTLWNRAARPGG